MPTATLSCSPKLNAVMKDFIEKLQHSLDHPLPLSRALVSRSFQA